MSSTFLNRLLGSNQGGVKTARPLNYIKVRFVNFDNTEKCIVASIVHSRKTEDGKVKTGVCFHSSIDKNKKFVADLIRTHYYGYYEAGHET